MFALFLPSRALPPRRLLGKGGQICNVHRPLDDDLQGNPGHPSNLRSMTPAKSLLLYWEYGCRRLHAKIRRTDLSVFVCMFGSFLL